MPRFDLVVQSVQLRFAQGFCLEQPVVPQKVVRREMLAAMIARVTKRTELGPLRALPAARHARVERGMRLSPAQGAMEAGASKLR